MSFVLFAFKDNLLTESHSDIFLWFPNWLASTRGWYLGNPQKWESYSQSHIVSIENEIQVITYGVDIIYINDEQEEYKYWPLRHTCS